ncbi:MAG: helix-turn-helix transcriptional regulator, partial [Deltaproteobacteria bacterium]|nr:helix-turn-helix transcriptional regulator [Deltaproteobacteria bacterium]
MKSLQVGDRNSDFDDRAFRLDDFSQINPQKAITILQHQMAVQKASNMIKERIQDLPTLSELAKSTGLSRTYFSYVFKEVTGMRLQDYLTQTRLNKAKELLGNIDLKIKQIAYEAGFSDPNYFCRTFKKK